MSARLALHLLGAPTLQLDGTTAATTRRKAIALLAYLAVNRGKHTRDSLSALLWPDYEQSKAYASLRNTLWDVGQALGEGWINASRETIEINTQADIWLDVRQFDDLLTAGRDQTDPALRIALLADSVKIYRSHFLTGFSLKDAHPFNEWAFAEAEELRRKLAEALTLLVESHGKLNQADSAIPYARRLITLDPLNEAAHRQLMEVYLQAGQHSAALKQYQTCEQILRTELNLDPQPETRELYRKIRKRDLKPARVEIQPQPAAPQHNLPFQLSTFIGREKELAEVVKLLARHRLVTLAGAGGIGKTRLSLQVGQKLLHEYPAGIWFIALDSLSDPALVPQTVAATFDIREGADRPILEKLTDALRGQTALLVFDNCEHLLDACAQLAEVLLQNCPNLKILASSRETLNVPGEAVHYISSLSIPEGAVLIEKLTEYESVQLFTERAGLALSSFTLTKENAETVVEICRKVDGIPLAIELAAARVNFLQVDEILQQLHDSFALLASDRRMILPRHQTIHASIDWSWRLLGEPEQTILRQLAVFAGGWTLESARAVCDGDVLALTNALVKKSLIVVDQRTGRETRYRFHEMVREFAHAQLVETGEAEIVRTRHLNYFVQFAEQAELELRGPAFMSWMERLDNDRNNIRAALHWADKIDVEAGLYLAGRLRRYWESSDLREGIRWLERFLHKSASSEFPLARAYALLTCGWLITWLQQFTHARSVTEESLALFRSAGYQQGEADALASLGNIAQFLDEPDAAVELIHRSLALAQSLNDSWREANAYFFLGWDRRDSRRALQYWDKALSLYQAVGDQVALGNLHGMLGQFLVLYGDLETGEQYLDEALRLSQSAPRANIWENARIAKSVIALMRGQPEEARTLLHEALDATKATGNKMAYLWVQVRLGHVELHAGNVDQARDMLLEIAQSFYEDSYAIGAIFALEGIAYLCAETGKHPTAARLVGLADKTREKMKDTRPLLEQVDVDKIIDAGLIKMGEAAFSDAYDQGTEMTIDEAITFAQRELIPSALRPPRKTDRPNYKPGNRNTSRDNVQEKG